MFITTGGGGGPTAASMADQSLSRLYYMLKYGDRKRMYCWRMRAGGRIEKRWWKVGTDK